MSRIPAIGFANGLPVSYEIAVTLCGTHLVDKRADGRP